MQNHKKNIMPFPASVIEIGEDAFRYCPALITVHPDNHVYKSENGKIMKKKLTVDIQKKYSYFYR